MNDGYDVFELESGKVLSHEDTIDDALDLLLRLEKDEPGKYWVRAVEA